MKIEGQDPILPSLFRLGETAAMALAASGIAAADLWHLKTGKQQSISVDVAGAAASLLSFMFQKLDGPETPLRITNPTQALYRTQDDRWVHLHGGFEHLADGTLAILKCENTEEDVANSVVKWNAQELEDGLADAGMCGAIARTEEEWRHHPQGVALLNEPPVKITKIGSGEPESINNAQRPLNGVRVLDLTRVLAGPTCARTLASHGADVLKINGPHLQTIPAFVMDTGHGKRSAYLDLNQPTDLDQLKSLISTGDVFSQGYRAGSLDRKGLSPKDLHVIRPGIIYVSINCYGHVGPWNERPGWEQLAQTATGIAIEEGGATSPRLAPAAATDYTTGYLAALGVMSALKRRAKEGGSYLVEASLCQTAMWLQEQSRVNSITKARDLDETVMGKYMATSQSGFGPLTHLGPILEMSATLPRWEQPTVPLGSHPATWNQRSESEAS